MISSFFLLSVFARLLFIESDSFTIICDKIISFILFMYQTDCFLNKSNNFNGLSLNRLNHANKSIKGKLIYFPLFDPKMAIFGTTK